MEIGKIQLGGVELKNNVILAPLAGVTDSVFRLIAKEYGGGLVYTEMASSCGVVRGDRKTLKVISFKREEKPISVQIFGADPQIVTEAAKVVEAKGADIIDFNLGCPSAKIVKAQAGSALLRDLKLARQIFEAIVRAVCIPVTIKIRAGWDKENINAVEVAKVAEESGISAVTIHARTKKEGFSGRANWEIIKEVKNKVRIPVIGNGDIKTPEDAKIVLGETGCEGVMIGRGALGNPWIFRRTIHYLEKGELLPSPNPEERIQVALEHGERLISFYGEYKGIRLARKHIAWYLRELPKAAQVRRKINSVEIASELKQTLLRYLNYLKTKTCLYHE